jgi:hypothetical protein
LDQGPQPQPTDAAPIHFIIWQPPGETSPQYQKRSQVPRWRKELDSFILSLPRRDGWEAARREAGLHTAKQNQLAVRLILGKRSRAGWRLPGYRSLTFYPFVQQMIGNWSLGDVGMDSGCWSARKRITSPAV